MLIYSFAKHESLTFTSSSINK